VTRPANIGTCQKNPQGVYDPASWDDDLSVTAIAASLTLNRVENTSVILPSSEVVGAFFSRLDDRGELIGRLWLLRDDGMNAGASA
jgi:hypothetical protein